MPNAFTFRIPSSPKNAVIIDIVLVLKLPQDEKSVSLKLKALVDTGATGTCISKRIALACNFKPISAVILNSVQGQTVVPVYEGDITLPCGTEFKNVPLTETSGSRYFDVIIGMDILSKGDIALTSDKNELVFSMRFPSENIPIDFTA